VDLFTEHQVTHPHLLFYELKIDQKLMVCSALVVPLTLVADYPW
jgi:hypothetical protein